MVHCIVVGCGSKSGKHKINFSKIPKIVTNQGKEWEELTRERRNRWISAVSRGDTEAKNVLESERVCGRHFVSGKPAPSWDKHNIYWVPTLNLGKKEYKECERKEQQQKAAGERAERAKERRKRNIEQQEAEVAEKKKHLNQSGNRVVNIPFSEASTSTEAGNADTAEAMLMEQQEASCSGATSEGTEEFVRDVESSKDAATQTEEFEYMFFKPIYQAPDRFIVI